MEVLGGCFSDSGTTLLYGARFHVIEAAGNSTLVSYTEQIVFLDGRDGTWRNRGG
jgi:hypothetical protein